MPRTAVTPFTPLGPYPAGGTVSALALDVAWTAADVGNSNKCIYTGKEVLLVWNTDASGHHFTLTSEPDEHGRSADITSYAIAAATVSMFNLRAGLAGWLQADGNFYFSADNALVKFAIAIIP